MSQGSQFSKVTIEQNDTADSGDDSLGRAFIIMLLSFCLFRFWLNSLKSHHLGKNYSQLVMKLLVMTAWVEPS